MRVLVEAPLARVAAAIPRTMGRLEEVDERRTRLVGSTRNVASYAQQLTMLPGAFRIEQGAEVHAALAALVERISTAVASSPAAR